MAVSLFSLWSAILLSAVAVFLAGNLVWIVMKYHKSDWKKLPDEEAVRSLLKGLPPGHYAVPFLEDFKDREKVEWQKKFTEGPVVNLNVFPLSPVSSQKPLAQWLSYCLAISIGVACIGAATLAAGTSFLKVFLVTGAIALLAYSGSTAVGSIWYGQTWARTAKDILDGLIYGLVTGLIFGWLWP